MLFNSKLFLVCIFIVTVFCCLPRMAAIAEDNNPLTPLVNAALKDPNMEKKKIRERFAKDSGWPFGPDELWTYQLATKSQGRHKRAMYIRPRDFGRIDIVMIDIVDEKEAFFYHTTTDGKLIRAVRAHGAVEVIPIDKATNDFESEIAFWKSWIDSVKVPDASK